MMHDAHNQAGFCWKEWGLVLALSVLIVGCGESESTDAGNQTSNLTASADTMTIERVLQTDDRFSTLVAALDSTGLDSALGSDGPYTLFAPPNSAFGRLPDGTVDVLLEARTNRLRTILAHHVVEGRVDASALSDTTALSMLGGDSLRVRSDTTLRVGPATVVDDDIAAANGLIHVLDRVLPPPAENE